MPISKEVRLLESRWKSGHGWPKRLEWIEITGLRGWAGQRIPFQFPIVALVGENGVGKSTVLQAIAASYKGARETQYYASDFFPDTPWEEVKNIVIKASVQEGPSSSSIITSMRKPTERWRGNEDRRERNTEYVDLRRIQPIAARLGYARMAKRDVKETNIEQFDSEKVERLSRIMGKQYDLAKLSLTNLDELRRVPVLSKDKSWYSGFHSGAGETTIAELIQRGWQKYSIILIDEVETSLHPRTQRRLIRDIATLCRNLELQCILTTHSPYILDELPSEGRIYLMETEGHKKIITGVSPMFAMTKMDDEVYTEMDVYMEDENSIVMLGEIVARSNQPDLLLRYQAIPYGAANVGRALGIMVKEKRFPRPTVVFLDGDQDQSDGCLLLPGKDAPERVVFEGLTMVSLEKVAKRMGRFPDQLSEACKAAMLLSDHHEWIRFVADRLAVSGQALWQSMCAEWSMACLTETERERITDTIFEAIVQCGGSRHKDRTLISIQTKLFTED